jgi:hypothetical protein
MAVSTFHTWQLPEATLGKIRAMLEEAYGGDFSDALWVAYTRWCGMAMISSATGRSFSDN